MSQSKPDAAAAESAKRSSVFDHPLGFWFFFWGELAERCCYYGMRAILLLYMIQILKFEDSSANRMMSYFIAACYLLPLVGGYVADNYLGKYRTIIYFSIPYIFGQVLLGIASLHNETCLFLSLGLLAMGSGVIKPNISTLMGLTYDQRRPGKTKLRSDAFAMFYGAINIGSALSSFCVPAIRNYYGGDSRAYAIAFLFPAVLMIVAFIVFALGKPFYAKDKIARRGQLTPEERHERMGVLKRLFGLFLVVTVFWSVFDQAASTWTLFARDYLHLQLWGYKLSADQIQAINPVLIVLLLPPITMLWHLLSRYGIDLKPTSKMLIGFVLTTITMGIVAWAAFRGADAIVAGAPAALSGAEKTIAATTDLTESHQAAEEAAEGLLAAVVNLKAVESEVHKIESDEAKEKMLDDAKMALEAARGTAQKSGLKTVAVISARNAAAAATRAARMASDAAKATDDKSLEIAAEEVFALAKKAKAAAEATTEAVNLSIATDRNDESGNEKKDITLCSVAANRTTATAAAAVKAVKAALAGNQKAAIINASVAGVDAADAAVAAARVTADITGNDVPEVAAETEAAAANGRISLLWQFVPYLLITIAEICISVVGLELAFSAAPATMKSFVTACWLLTVFFANILNAQVTPLYNETFLGISLTPNWYFLIFAVFMVPVTLTFMVVSRRFNRPVKSTK